MKSLFKSLFINLGGELYLRTVNRTPRILFWHGMDINPNSIVEAESISKENFSKQIKYLKNNFDIISMDEFYCRYNDNKFSNREIVLTFDDGYKNNLTVLAPLLNNIDIPFTVFISTNHISTGNLFPTSIVRLIIFGSLVSEIDLPILKIKGKINDQEQKLIIAKKLNTFIKTAPLNDVNQICTELIANISKAEFEELKHKFKSIIPLNWEETKELLKYKCTIGSHCIDHICCHNNQSDDEVKTQITQSKLDIEKKLGIACDYFAYPNGAYTDFSNCCVEKAGYKLGFSTKKEKINVSASKQNLTIPRHSVPFNYDTFRIVTNLFPKKKRK